MSNNVVRHTPGPWKIDWEFAERVNKETGGNLTGAYVTGSDGRSVMKCLLVNAEASANSHLIASAPELLEAVQDCLYVIEAQIVKEFGDSVGNKMCDRLKALIAKAEGRL